MLPSLRDQVRAAHRAGVGALDWELDKDRGGCWWFSTHVKIERNVIWLLKAKHFPHGYLN